VKDVTVRKNPWKCPVIDLKFGWPLDDRFKCKQAKVRFVPNVGLAVEVCQKVEPLCKLIVIIEKHVSEQGMLGHVCMYLVSGIIDLAFVYIIYKTH
jgi:hypothetical protein